MIDSNTDYEGLSEEEIAAINDGEADLEGGRDQGSDDDKNQDSDRNNEDTVDNDDGARKEESGEDKGSDDIDSDIAKDNDGDSDSENDLDGVKGNAGDFADDKDQDGEKESRKDQDSDTDTANSTSPPDSDSADDRVGIDAQYNQKIAGFDKKLDDGDISFDEYKKGLAAIEREHTRAMVREEMAIAAAEQRWQAEQDDFFSKNDYLKENAILYNAFAVEVNRLIADRTWGKKAGPAILAEAKKNVDSAFSIQYEKTYENKDKNSDRNKAVQNAKNSSARRDVPKTLRDVPASTRNDDSGKFDYLDKLDGSAYENAIAKLTPEELEEYERQ